jgi:hypothetical protein
MASSSLLSISILVSPFADSSILRKLFAPEKHFSKFRNIASEFAYIIIEMRELSENIRSLAFTFFFRSIKALKIFSISSI